MEKAAFLFFLLLLIPFFGFTQKQDAFDYVSPFHEGFSAVKKGDQWAFINNKGDIVIGFRSDLVSTNMNGEAYPVFQNNRCLIKKNESNISYFGYINASGKTVIKPTFLNATNFKHNMAIVILLAKEKAGYNNIMAKDIVYYTYQEVVINRAGEVKRKLTEPRNIVLMKKFIFPTPKIMSKFRSNRLIIVPDKNQKWTLKKIAS